MNQALEIEPLNAKQFAPFGDVIEARGTADSVINRGCCKRFHDLAAMDFVDGRAGISVFAGTCYALPLELAMVERHPLGSQAFLPLSEAPYLVIVASDVEGTPTKPRVFKPAAGQGVNYHRNVWHGVLTPIEVDSLFAVVDRIGPGDNLEEHWFERPFLIQG